jgi:hypothetical protein
MNHPVIAAANGHERYNRMLNEAENYRRIKNITASQPKIRAFGKLRAKFASLVPQVVGKSADSPA